MSTRAPRVLLVSGDRALLRQLSRFLDLFGYPSRQAAEAATTCSLLADDPPDVLLADWEVQGSSGLELARLVRTSAYEGQCVYAVLVKENATSNELVQALEAGVDDFLARPIVHGELLARLRAAARTIAHQRGMRDRGRRDPLTGAAGPVALEEHLAKRLAAACREARPLACVAASFKQLFDAFLSDASTELVITQSGVPTGVVTRAGLASLIEPLSPDAGPDCPSR